MNIADMFTREDRTELSISQLCGLISEVEKAKEQNRVFRISLNEHHSIADFLKALYCDDIKKDTEEED